MTNKNRIRRVGSIRNELVAKSREAALCAIRIYNDPQVTFKSESFIVLMVIAWTYMLHAYFRENDVEYRYYSQGPKRRRFVRTKHGSHKYWELEQCLRSGESPVDPRAALNLRFLLGIRHEIEHQMTLSLDSFLSARYQACARNYNDHLKRLFGEKYGLDEQVAICLQFLDLSRDPAEDPSGASPLPAAIAKYIADFDGQLDHDEYNSPQYAYRLVFKQKLVNRPGQADRVVEFIPSSSDSAAAIDKEYWVKKEVERPKYRPTDVCRSVAEAGFTRFRPTPEHSDMWKRENAKDPAKGFGVEVRGVWYWYESWIHRCIELCSKDSDAYSA